MELKNTQRIQAPRGVVWEALNDEDVLRRCIPGCESIERLSPTELTAKVVLKVGPVKATFAARVTLEDLDPPSGCRIVGEGSGGVAGQARGSAVVRLTGQEDGATVLDYDVRADISGKLAQLGSRLIDATARKLAAEFFTAFGTVLAPAATPDGPVADGATPANPSGPAGPR